MRTTELSSRSRAEPHGRMRGNCCALPYPRIRDGRLNALRIRMHLCICHPAARAQSSVAFRRHACGNPSALPRAPNPTRDVARGPCSDRHSRPPRAVLFSEMQPPYLHTHACQRERGAVGTAHSNHALSGVAATSQEASPPPRPALPCPAPPRPAPPGFSPPRCRALPPAARTCSPLARASLSRAKALRCAQEPHKDQPQFQKKLWIE
jgi:hypothetical protein